MTTPDLFSTDQTITRKAPRRKPVRAFAGEQAAHVLDKAQFGKGVEIMGFTKGQFSFVDLIQAVLQKTGPANLTLSTWAASVADLGRISLFYDDGMILSPRFLLDGAFESYNKESAIQLREKFGDEAIRIVPNHSKFAIIRNDDWAVTIQTSMNLNQNKRLESFSLTECPEFCDVYAEIVCEIWGLQKAGAGFGPTGYRASSNTLGRLGEGRTSSFFDVTPGSALL